MITDLGYCLQVLKRIVVVFLSILTLYLAFKLSVFYMPFLIAFIIALLIEPIIKYLMKKQNLNRKSSAIIVLLIVFFIIIGLLIWGITTLISESSDFLNSINEYFEKISTQINNIINSFKFDDINIPEEVKNILSNTINESLDKIANLIKNFLNTIINTFTKMPSIVIYIVVTLLSIYFICTDKIYILDQLEHHIPKIWVKKLIITIKEISKTLGKYLKAELILVGISFIISLIGLYIYKIVGFNIEYPLLIALGIGFIDLLPILGSGAVMVPWAIISSINGDIKLGIAIFVLWIIMSIVKQLLEPKIVGNGIGIHPIFTLISMYTGFKIIGIAGMLLGPIILIILKNVFGRLIDNGVIKTIFNKR